MQYNNFTLLSELKITGLTADSRKVKKGMLFAAIKGNHIDGTLYINEAIKKGAIAILAPLGTKISDNNVTLLESDNCRATLSKIASCFYKNQPDNIMAVTGTNGKSSTVFFVSQILSLLGEKSVSIGTLGIHGDNISVRGAMTTLDPIELHKNLDVLYNDNIDYVAIEASSHGIIQHRMDNVKLKVAAFTNFTQDHLDYHGSMDEYFAAKSRLFQNLLPKGAYAVLNSDIPEYDVLSKICKLRDINIIDFGYKSNSIKIIERIATNDGQFIKIEIKEKIYEAKLHLVGEFQLMNILAAIGIIVAVKGYNILTQIFELLPNLQAPNGRMQLISGHPDNASIYVDYAHTPDALENVIQALRPHTDGKLVCIIGCGGDRDSGKRPIMGHVAAKHADITIITDDNPRSEDPQEIRGAMLSGVPLELKPSLLEIGDRHQAILKGISLLESGDVLLIAGKGHETGQIINSETLPFDDVQQAQQAISNLINQRKSIS